MTTTSPNNTSVPRVEARAQWIGQSWMRDVRPVGGHPIAFRKNWTIRDCTGATIRICGWPRYALYVNGRVVGYGPARSFPNQPCFDTWQLDSHVVQGENMFAVILLPHTGVTGYATISRLGLWAQGWTAGAGDESIYTDETWRVRDANWISDTSALISMPVGAQEHFLGFLEPRGWKTAPPDDGWSDAFVIGPAGTAPWRDLQPRPLALLAEAAAEPRLSWRGTGTALADGSNCNLARAFADMALTSVAANLDERHSIEATAGDVFTFDFGRTRLIRPGIAVTAATGETRFELYYATAFSDRPLVDMGFGTTAEGAVDSYAPPSTGHGDWEALSPRGMRFLSVRIAGAGKCSFRLAAKTVDYPFSDLGPCPAADPVLSRIWAISADTLRSSTNDCHVDCCTRENVLWTFDACVSGEASWYTFGESATWRRGLALIAQGIDSGGMPKAVVPSEASFMCLVDQALTWVSSCARYIATTGDGSLASDVAAPVSRLLSMCAAHIRDEGYYVPPSHSWNWVDWAPIDKRPYSLPVNALLAVAAAAAAAIASVAADTGLAALGGEIHLRLASRLAKFFDDDMGCFRSHIEPAAPITPTARTMTDPNGLPHGIHGNCLAVAAGIGTQEQREAAMKFVAARLSEPLGPNNEFGPGWTEILLNPVFDYGHEDVAVDFIKRAYGIAIDAGAPTWGEGFGAGVQNSAHGWGASVNTLLAKRFPRK